MKVSRREAAKILLAATVAAPSFGQSAPSVGAQTWDVAVIGAGVFGAWSAYWLRKQGLSDPARCLRSGKQPGKFRRRIAHYPRGVRS